MHCNENPIYVFLFWELRSLSPNFHIHVSVSNLYIPRIGPHISYSRIDRSLVGIYKSLTDTSMWKLGLWPRHSFSGNICFEFSVLALCSVSYGGGGGEEGWGIEGVGGRRRGGERERGGTWDGGGGGVVGGMGRGSGGRCDGEGEGG